MMYYVAFPNPEAMPSEMRNVKRATWCDAWAACTCGGELVCRGRHACVRFEAFPNATPDRTLRRSGVNLLTWRFWHTLLVRLARHATLGWGNLLKHDIDL